MVAEQVVETDHTLIIPARPLAANGLEAWAEVLERGHEGLVGKDESSAYLGGRPLSWIKVRQRDYRVEERGWSQDVERSPKRRLGGYIRSRIWRRFVSYSSSVISPRSRMALSSPKRSAAPLPGTSSAWSLMSRASRFSPR